MRYCIRASQKFRSRQRRRLRKTLGERSNMAIRVPGNRKGAAKPGKRVAVMVLNITAMVDMFTVLTVFLLQNYAQTNQVLPLVDNVDLPKAHETKELKPSNVVVVSA